MNTALVMLFVITASAAILILCVYWANQKKLNGQLKVFHGLTRAVGLSDKKRITLALLNTMKYDDRIVDKALRRAYAVFYHNCDGIIG